MQTVGMGAAPKSEKNADGKFKKENRELRETMNALIAENESLHTKIGALEVDLKEAMEAKPVEKSEEPEVEKLNKK